MSRVSAQGSRLEFDARLDLSTSAWREFEEAALNRHPPTLRALFITSIAVSPLHATSVFRRLLDRPFHSFSSRHNDVPKCPAAGKPPARCNFCVWQDSFGKLLKLLIYSYKHLHHIQCALSALENP